MAAPDRGRRLEHQQRAYELQLAGGFKGMAKWTIGGALAIGAAHYSLPGFRKQTLGLKAFLLSSATICGLVIGADDYLLKYESAQRDAENAIRREARNALALKGIIATEGEIRKWRVQRDRELAREASDAVDAAEAFRNVEASVVAKLAQERRFNALPAAVKEEIVAEQTAELLDRIKPKEGE